MGSGKNTYTELKRAELERARHMIYILLGLLETLYDYIYDCQVIYQC